MNINAIVDAVLEGQDANVAIGNEVQEGKLRKALKWGAIGAAAGVPLYLAHRQIYNKPNKEVDSNKIQKEATTQSPDSTPKIPVVRTAFDVERNLRKNIVLKGATRDIEARFSNVVRSSEKHAKGETFGAKSSDSGSNWNQYSDTTKERKVQQANGNENLARQVDSISKPDNVIRARLRKLKANKIAIDRNKLQNAPRFTRKDVQSDPILNAINKKVQGRMAGEQAARNAGWVPD